MSGKHLSKDDFENVMRYIFDLAEQNEFAFITRSFIKSIDNIPSVSCIEKACREYYSCGLSTYIRNNGFQTGKQGRGMRFIFEDDDISTSQFEYLFSISLREFGLIYNRDYFRR